MDNNVAQKERLAALKNDNKWIRKMFILMCFHITQLFTPERMLGHSMAMTMISAAPDLYPNDPEKQVDLVKRHSVFFNTQQGFGGIIWGIMLGMEIERARTDGGVPDDMIQSIKTALASPIAGIGDTLWQILFTPLLLSIGIGMSTNGSMLGPVFCFLVYVLVNTPLTYVLFKMGIKLGVDGADMLIGSEIKDRLMMAVETMGLIVVGGVVAGMANVRTGLVLGFNGVQINVQTEFFDAIYPGLLTMGGMYLTYWLVKEKKLSAMKIMFGMLAVAAIGYFTTILA